MLLSFLFSSSSLTVCCSHIYFSALVLLMSVLDNILFCWRLHVCMYKTMHVFVYVFSFFSLQQHRFLLFTYIICNRISDTSHFTHHTHFCIVCVSADLNASLTRSSQFSVALSRSPCVFDNIKAQHHIDVSYRKLWYTLRK